MFAQTPKPPYYACIFTSCTPQKDEEYEAMAQHLEELARSQPGFLGIESARNQDGLGISVSYWQSRQAMADWKAHWQHAQAQEQGKTSWYSGYRVRIAQVSEDYDDKPS